MDLEGSAEWHVLNDNVHPGRFAGSAIPVEGDVDFSRIDMTLIGDYMVAGDNMKCGGMNVHFQGIWRRGASPP